MARRKKKSKASVQGAQTTPEQVLKAKKTSGQDGAPLKSEPALSIPQKQPKTGKPGISIATCLAGMFLSLVLGIYLGTLLPDLMLKTPVASIPESNNGRPAPASVPSAPTDPELRNLVADLEKKADANPDSAPDLINLGNIYFDSQQPEKAINAYERALKLAPQNADVLTDLGIMYRETGQFEKAIECFRKAIAINPRHENAMYNEGVVLLNDLNKKSEAADAWQRLLEINPVARSPQGKPLKDMIGELR